MPASSKEFLDIQATIECGFTLKSVRDMTRTYKTLFNINGNKYYYNILLEKVFDKKINPIHNIFKCIFVYYKCYLFRRHTNIPKTYLQYRYRSKKGKRKICGDSGSTKKLHRIISIVFP